MRPRHAVAVTGRDDVAADVTHGGHGSHGGVVRLFLEPVPPLVGRDLLEVVPGPAQCVEQGAQR